MVQPPVGTEAVETVQFTFDRKSVPQEHPPQRGLPHLQHVLELHVLAHASHDFVDLFAWKPQPSQDLICYFCARCFMAKKMDRAGLRVARSGRRLADVVQQRRPNQRRRRVRGQMFKDSNQVVIHSPFRMKVP